MNVTTPDGRTLRVHLGGDENGIPVVAHHGTPGAGTLYEPLSEDARRRGICLIGYDRPGYGGSTRHPGRTIGDCVADVRAIAAALGVERIATWGVSGGGPHALACAALAPDLVAASACVAGITPYFGESFFDGMSDENVHEFRLALEGETAVREYTSSLGTAMLAGLDELKEGLGSLLAPVDAAALNGPLGTYFGENLRDAIEGGVDGWVDDDLAFAGDWGFDPARPQAPVLILYGALDAFVPRSHFDWLAAHVEGAEVRLEPEHGHLSLVDGPLRDAHAWLVEDRSIPPRS